MQGNWRQKYLRYKTYLLNTVDRYEERTDVRIYLEILLSLMTISIFSVFALRPTILTIAELIKEIEAKEVLIDKLDSKIQTITSAQILYDRQRENIKVLKEAIPNSPENDTLIYQLEGLVAKNNVVVDKVSLDGTTLLDESETKDQTSEEKETFTSFDIQLKGEYVAMFNFLKDLESLIMPVQVVSTSIVSAEDSETSISTLTLLITARVPFEKLDSTADR